MHTQLAHMPILLFRLHFHLCNSCVCVCKLVHTLPSSSIFIHIYRHIHMYICFHYCVMTPYNLYAPIITVSVHLLLEARCLHTCDPIFKSLYFNIHPCLYSYECTHTMFVPKKWNSVCTYPSHMCNHVFFLICSIHLNTCSRVNVNNKTVQSTNKQRSKVFPRKMANVLKMFATNPIR